MLLHQTIVGQEAREQLAMAGAEPDVLIGCVGGGSNFAGLVFPFLADKAAGRDIRIVAAEPAACPTLTRGHYGYDFGDTAKTAPLLAMHTLGHGFVPPAIHSGGLRYHGMAPLVSHLVHTGLVEARAYKQSECFAEAVRFARAEGIIPAPEPSHALRAVVEEVERAARGGRRADDPLQPLRPRQLRHGRLRRVPVGRDGRHRAAPGRARRRRRRAGGAARPAVNVGAPYRAGRRGQGAVPQ